MGMCHPLEHITRWPREVGGYNDTSTPETAIEKRTGRKRKES